MANDDNSSIIFRGWLSVMIVLPATRTDWASCKFVHGFCVRSMVAPHGQWWQLINHLSGLIVWDDGVYQLLELIGPAVSLCMVCVSEAWLCGMASDDNSSIIFRGWLSVMIVLPASRTDWASCKLLVAWYGQRWQLINHLSGLIVCDDCVYQLLELIGPAVSLCMVCVSEAWLCGMASDDNSSIIFRGWLTVMIVFTSY